MNTPIFSVARRGGLLALSLLCTVWPSVAGAQDQAATAPPGSGLTKPDSRTQLPQFLWDAYLGLNIGYLSNPFSAEQLQPGFRTGSVTVPHAAFGIGLFGYRFDHRFSAQITYLRPVKFVRYRNINGQPSSNSVWMAYGAFTVKARIPISEVASAYAEAGIAASNRRGFQINGVPVIANSFFRTIVVGGGVDYRLSKSWDLVAGALYSPPHSRTHQPRALFVSGGVRYNLQMVPPERVVANATAGFAFPEHLLVIGYSTPVLGYGANRLLSKQVPIFWGGKINVQSGAAIHYQRNVFHTRKRFGLDLGASLSRYESAQHHDTFTAVSLYPQLRFMLVRGSRADLFVTYSVAGPTFISRKVIDGQETGLHRFTFQDGLGLGAYFGRDKHGMFGIKLGHYSNGNLVGGNPGIAVPIAFELGYAF